MSQELEKLYRQKRELQLGMNETTQRIQPGHGERKNMNGYQWDDRIEHVDKIKRIDKQISEHHKDMLKHKRMY